MLRVNAQLRDFISDRSINSLFCCYGIMQAESGWYASKSRIIAVRQAVSTHHYSQGDLGRGVVVRVCLTAIEVTYILREMSRRGWQTLLRSDLERLEVQTCKESITSITYLALIGYRILGLRR